ncbi:hypothetical protein D3C72_1651470 [compost metagenome]
MRHPGQSQPVVGIEDDLARGKSRGDRPQQAQQRILGQIQEQAFRDDQRGLTGGNPPQPRQIGDRRTQQTAARPDGIQLAPQLDDLGIVDLEPIDPERRVHPEHTGVQSAPQVQHRGVAMRGNELAGPPVQRMGPRRQADHFVAAHAQPGKIVVDTGDGRRRVVVPQQGARQAAFLGLGVKRDEERRLFTREMDLFHAGPVSRAPAPIP